MQRCGEVTMTITSQDYFIEPSADTSCLHSDCAEPTPLSPYWEQPVPSESFQSSMETLDVGITRQGIVPGGDAIFVWALNQTSLIVDWENPTIACLMDGNSSYPNTSNALPTVNEGTSAP